MLTKRHVSQLQKIVDQLQKILVEANGSESSKARSAGKRIGDVRSRRSAKEVTKMKKEIVAARKKGARVTDLAKEYGVTTSYIYQL